jgi:predicted small lipoprotein YifL
MRVPQSARCTLTAVLVLALAACGKDGSGPSEFDPDGTTADMSSADEAFGAPASESFAAVGTDISLALGGSAVVASSASLATTTRPELAARYGRQMASLLPGRSGGIQASVSAIPSAALGVTYVWDETTDAYVESSLTGAPSNGVRFILYAVNPVTHRPVEPVTEVGYVDVIDESGSTTDAFRVIVVSDDVTYLDYSLTAQATSSGGTVTISGYATDGATRANFNLENTITEIASGFAFTLDYDLDVPSRDLSVDYTLTWSTADTSSLELDLSISGSNGNVRVTGSYDETGGELNVRVNGDVFATVTLEGGTTVVTGASGEPLTAAEQETLQTILGWYDGSLLVFGSLLAPIV